MNLTLQGLSNSQAFQQTTKASTKASKAHLNKTEQFAGTNLSSKNRGGSNALKNAQNSALKKRALNASYNSTKGKVGSNEKMPSGGGSRVQVNNYFTMGPQNGLPSGSALKSEIKRKRISQNLHSNGVLQPPVPKNDNVSAQCLKQ